MPLQGDKSEPDFVDSNFAHAQRPVHGKHWRAAGDITCRPLSIGLWLYLFRLTHGHA